MWCNRSQQSFGERFFFIRWGNWDIEKKYSEFPQSSSLLVAELQINVSVPTPKLPFNQWVPWGKALPCTNSVFFHIFMMYFKKGLCSPCLLHFWEESRAESLSFRSLGRMEESAFPHRYSKVKSYLIGKPEIFIWIYCTFRRLDASVIQEMLSVVAPHTNLNQCAANLKAEVLSVSIYNKTGPHKMGWFFCHNNLSVWSVTMLEITVADFCLFVSLCF